MGAKRAAENAPSISANAFDDFQSTGLTGYNVPSKNSHEARVSLNSSGLTPTAASTAVSAASGVWLRRVLLAVAAFEALVGGLIDLAVSVPDLNARLSSTRSLRSRRLCSPRVGIFVPRSSCLQPIFSRRWLSDGHLILRSEDCRSWISR